MESPSPADLYGRAIVAGLSQLLAAMGRTP
jgi:hypothetical protein